MREFFPLSAFLLDDIVTVQHGNTHSCDENGRINDEMPYVQKATSSTNYNVPVPTNSTKNVLVEVSRGLGMVWGRRLERLSMKIRRV